jgi:hypothetical protein
MVPDLYENDLDLAAAILSIYIYIQRQKTYNEL